MASTRTVKNQLATQEQAAGPNGQVAERSEFAKVNDWLELLKPEIARALPDHLKPDRLARLILNDVRKIPLLARCTPESFGGAIMTCAQLGLEPGAATGEAYLLPFKNTDRDTGRVFYEVQLIVGYQGMAKLFWQSPMARSLDAQAVYPEDEFDYEYGLTPVLRHRPSLDRAADSTPYAYYAVATTTTGGSAFVVMSRRDVEQYRRRSKSPNKGPWVSDYDAMAKKTCLRRLFKLMPKSPVLAAALAHDGTVRTDRAPDALETAPAYLEGEIVRNGNGGGHAPAGVDETTGEVTDPAVLAEAGNDGEPDWEAIDAAREAEEETQS
jgi:recombination protein RecT